MTNSGTQRVEQCINIIVVFSISIICYFYSLFTSRFAEIHLNIPKLGFPIFVGEVLLFCCMSLLILQLTLQHRSGLLKWTRWHTLVIIYIFWVLLRALLGFIHWGPLALRHAALFYYPWFAFLIVHFSKRFSLNDCFIFIILLILGLTFSLGLVGRYYYLTYLLLVLSLLLLIQRKWLKYFLGLTFLIIFGVSMNEFFMGSRSHLVSIVLALFFLVVFVVLIQKDKKRAVYHILIMIIFFLLSIAGIWTFADKNALESMVKPQPAFESYKEHKKRINRELDNFTFRELPPKLYFKETIGFKEIIGVQAKEIIKNKKDVHIPTEIIKGETTVEKDRENKIPHRNLDTAYNNILFRIFIWEDMVNELIAHKAWLGFHFGKPLRSKQIEILEWAWTEWMRDGWITAHNSFLHIVYRAGIIGLFMVGFIVAMIFQMTHAFVKSQSFIGGFLVAILVYWITISQFLVILELPYTAIPFWSIFGLCTHHYVQLKNQHQGENTTHSQ